MLLNKLAFAMQAALLAVEENASGDTLSALKALHSDLLDIAKRHADAIGLSDIDLTAMAAPKDPPPNNN